MTRVWRRRHLSWLLIAYAAAACGGPLVYASSQVLLERANPTGTVAPGDGDSTMAWVPIVRRQGGVICALGKDERSTCLKPTADRAEVDIFIGDLERVYKDYCNCAPTAGDAPHKMSK